MTSNRFSRRQIAATVLVLALVVTGCGGVAVPLVQVYQSGAYPGAQVVADDNLVRYMPTLVWRRTTTYRSNDPFPKVYNWYSSSLDLGPETYAQSNCILMARSSTLIWSVNEQTSVMVCNTVSGQMMFVMRSFYLHYRG